LNSLRASSARKVIYERKDIDGFLDREGEKKIWKGRKKSGREKKKERKIMG
jgi:hypothetical protein